MGSGSDAVAYFLLLWTLIDEGKQSGCANEGEGERNQNDMESALDGSPTHAPLRGGQCLWRAFRERQRMMEHVYASGSERHTYIVQW